MESGNVHIQNLLFYVYVYTCIYITYIHNGNTHTHTTFYQYVAYTHVYVTDEAGDVNQRVRWYTHTGVNINRG